MLLKKAVSTIKKAGNLRSFGMPAFIDFDDFARATSSSSTEFLGLVSSIMSSSTSRSWRGMRDFPVVPTMCGCRAPLTPKP
eukprot:Skav224477  [mRNA]  locus=scaffold1302:680251:680493:+ [translate_table: standard]